MITKYKFLDKSGKPLTTQLQPWTEYPVSVVAVEYRPALDSEITDGTDEDELIVTLKFNT